MDENDFDDYDREAELALFREYRTVADMSDVWVWDIYRTDRFVQSVRVLTFKDVNIEELTGKAFDLPKELTVGE